MSSPSGYFTKDSKVRPITQKVSKGGDPETENAARVKIMASRPREKYYVTMTDKFMSGWGQAAGKVNKLVIETDSYEEAEIVAENARNRSEMKNVNIAIRKPRYDASRYKVSEHDKSDYSRWFQRGAFKRQ